MGRIKQSNMKYKEAGDVSYYQDKENHVNMTSWLCAEVRAYKEFRDELKEVLDHTIIQWGNKIIIKTNNHRAGRIIGCLNE